MNGARTEGGGGRHGSGRDHYSSRDERRGDRTRDSGRRRSRSPQHRSSRRDYEVDTYSSSRDYREREREDRHAGRREDRGWDRDRDPRRERRDGGDSRRDRGDLLDERRGGGRRDRDDAFGGRGGRQAERKKSASPPPKKKEPTPDLTDIISVLERKRRLTQWDIKPPGYENVTAEQAKLSGMFPLPGAPRQQPMDPSKLQAFMNQPAGSAAASLLKPSNARQAKRLLVHNLPASATDDGIQTFFNLQMNDLNIVSGADPCISAHVSPDKKFALLEFRAPEDATLALAFDGIQMEDNNNMETSNGTGDTSGLSIRRPKDYIVPTSDEEEQPQQEGVVSNVVKDSPNKVSITRIPPYLDEDQVTELLKAFGDLKSFVLVRDRGTQQSRGIAFCEFMDATSTDICVEGLNGMELGDENLRVTRASIGITQAAGLEMGVNAMSMLAGTTSNEGSHSRVLQLLNMVTPEELIDNAEYQEILEDVKEEMVKYGQVISVKIPRPSGGRQNPGVGKIFVKFGSEDVAQKAMAALGGRNFNNRTVVATYFAEEYFDVDAW